MLTSQGLVGFHLLTVVLHSVAHVAHLGPAFWSATFQVTAYLLAVSEVFGAAAAWVLMASRTRFLKQYATRTGF